MEAELSEADGGRGTDCRVGKSKAELYEIAARQGKKAYENMAYENHRLFGSQKKKIRNTHSMNVNKVVVVSMMMMRVGDQLLVLLGQK